MFGKTYDIRGHELENELINLNPNIFDTIQDFISRFKSASLQFKECKIDKDDEQLILTILLNIFPDYSIFVSSFHDTKLTTQNWNMPSLEDFMESLT